MFKQTSRYCVAIVGIEVRVKAATKDPRLLLEDEQWSIMRLHAAIDLSLQVRQEGAVGGRGDFYVCSTWLGTPTRST